MKNKILIIEPDMEQREALVNILTEENYFVITSNDAEKGLERIWNGKPDLVICSANLSRMTGIQFVSFLRTDARLKHIPIIMVSKPCPAQEIISFFNAGIDEHLFYNMEAEEIAARIRALLRRVYPVETSKQVYEYAGLRLNIDEHQVTVHNQNIVLTRKEFDLLKMLLSQPDKVLAIPTLLHSIWGYGKDIPTKTLQVHISRLRHKLGPVANRVKNFPGVGYAFSTDIVSPVRTGGEKCLRVF